MVLSQGKSIRNLLHETKIDDAKVFHNPMLSDKQISLYDGDLLSMTKLYKSNIRALQYLTHTRFEISFQLINLFCLFMFLLPATRKLVNFF